MRIGLWVLAGLAGVVLTAAPAARAEVSVTGTGATFPQPLYEKWISVYTKAHPDVKISYNAIGSGGGIKQITAKEVDFGASDAPLSEKEKAAALRNGQDLLQIPMTLGAVVPIYSVDGLGAGATLKFSGPVLADLFSGKIRKWNDARIKDLNPDVADKLPNADVKIVHRDDPSGTTYVFTEFLSKHSSDWKATKASDVWAKDAQRGKGNDRVSDAVKSGSNTLGYVELSYALTNKLAFGDVQNKAGKFIHASIESVSASASVKQLPADLSQLSLTNNDAEEGYPISATTYLLVPREIRDRAKAQAIARFVLWCLNDGQTLSANLSYAPLPDNVARAAAAQVQGISSGGKPVAQ